MKSTFKVINLSDGASSYTIGPSDNVSRILLVGGVISLARNIAIVWEGGNNNAPQDTMVTIHKTAAVALNAYNINVFGYNMPKDVAYYGDMLQCVKLHSTFWKITGYMGFSFAIAGIGIGGGGGIDPTDGLIGFGTKELTLDLASIVDGKTLMVNEAGKLSANIPSAEKIVLLDDFIDSTNKLLVEAALDVTSVGGVVKMIATSGGGYETSITDVIPQIGLSRSPSVGAYLNIFERGNGLIMIGLHNDFETPTRGAYFKLSSTSLEVFTVVNDGTERVATSGVTMALSTNYRFEIKVDSTGKSQFFINNVLVRNETTYSIADTLYANSVSVSGGTTDTIMFVDYVNLELSRT